MDRQPSLIPDPARMSLMMQAGFLPPTDKYSTFIHLFPGNNAHKPWGETGHFYIEAVVYVNGKETGRVKSEVCDEKGNLRVELNQVTEVGGKPAKGMFIVHYHHDKDIPIEVYAFHVHKETGTYVSCNVTPYIGDKLFPDVHTTQMENTLFWPGVIADEDNDPVAVVVNPYDDSMGLQIHLISPVGAIVRSNMLRVRAKGCEEFPLCQLFEDQAADMRKHNGKYSYCVSSQYKLITYFLLRNRTHKVISLMDHLHNFCLV